MSDNKRKRSEDHYQSVYKPTNVLQNQSSQQPIVADNPLLQQQVIVNSVLEHGEQFAEVEQVQLLNNHNSQSNVVYILLPPGVNQQQNVVQNVQTLLLVPKEEQVNAGQGPPQLHYYMPVPDKPDQKINGHNGDEVVFVKDVKLMKGEEETQPYLQTSVTDPLQIHTIQDGSNVSYTLVPQFEEIQQPPPPGNAFVTNKGCKVQKIQPESSESLKYKMQFRCDFPGCTVTFPSFYEKKIHAETHIFPASSEFKCTICNMVFDRAADRNKHVDSHAVVSTYKCKNCDKAFPYYTTLVRHINEEKCSSNKSFACHFCGVQFVDGSDLEKHQKENIKYCVCRAKICGEQSYDLHTNLCSVYKQKMSRAKNLKRKKGAKSDTIIMLD